MPLTIFDTGHTSKSFETFKTDTYGALANLSNNVRTILDGHHYRAYVGRDLSNILNSYPNIVSEIQDAFPAVWEPILVSMEKSTGSCLPTMPDPIMLFTEIGNPDPVDTVAHEVGHAVDMHLPSKPLSLSTAFRDAYAKDEPTARATFIAINKINKSAAKEIRYELGEFIGGSQNGPQEVWACLFANIQTGKLGRKPYMSENLKNCLAVVQEQLAKQYLMPNEPTERFRSSFKPPLRSSFKPPQPR